MLDEIFSTYDSDHDEYLNLEEFQLFLQDVMQSYKQLLHSNSRTSDKHDDSQSLDTIEMADSKLTKEDIITIFSLLNPQMTKKALEPPMIVDESSVKDFKANRDSIKIFL